MKSNVVIVVNNETPHERGRKVGKLDKGPLKGFGKTQDEAKADLLESEES